MKYTLPIIVVLLGLVGWFLYMHQNNTAILPTTTVQIGTTTIIAEVADTDATRRQGLSDRVSLEEGRGMLFIFAKEGDLGFWMKDMHFSLDIIFADASGKIVTVDHNVSPETYLTNPPYVFHPATPAQYVLEVPAGYAAAHGIVEGATMKME